MADKYYRLVCMVVNICHEPLREFFLKLAKSDPSATAVYTDLGAYLILRQPQIAHLKTKKIIRQDQYDLVFPSAGIANIYEWDVTLLVTLTKNLFRVVITPLEEFCLEEIRKIRNDLQHIPNTSAISDGEFDNYWNRLEKAAKTLAREVSGAAYESEIGVKVKEARYSNMPSLGNTLRIFYEEDRKEMSSKMASMEETIKSLEAKLDEVTANTAVSSSILSNVTVTKSGPNGEKVKRFKAVDDILHRLIKQLQSTMQTELHELFTPPTEIADIEAKLNDAHHVIVTGPRNSPYLETALYVIKNRAYNLQRCVEMNDASDWRHIDPEEVDLVLLKDPFGSYCYDITKAKSMLNIFDTIYHAVQPKQGQKTLDVIIVSDFAYLTEVNGFKEHELLNEVVKMFEPTSSSAPVEITTVAPTSIATSSNHFLRQMTDIFLSHFSEDSKRMDENTVKAAKEILKKNKKLVITGPVECGKTSLAVALAKSYAKDEVLMFSSPDKIETIDLQRTSLVIIDDFVGKYGFQRKKVIKWFLRFDQLYLAVAAGKLNIIVTCETSQLDKCIDEIKSHPLLSTSMVLTTLPTLVKQEISGDPGILEENNEEETHVEESEEESEDKDDDENIVEEKDEVKDEEEYEDIREEVGEEDEVWFDSQFSQQPRPYIQPETLLVPIGFSVFQMIQGREFVSANASHIIRYVTPVRKNCLTTIPKACCMLPDSEILLLDIFNHLIKLDSTYKEVGFGNLKAFSNVTGVCYIGNNTAVVCGNELLIYIDVGSMTVKNTINTDVKSGSIACNNKMLYVLGEDNVHTYTVNGIADSILCIRRADKDLFWDFQIPTLKNIAVSDDGSTIYIITSDSKLMTIDRSDNHLLTLSLSCPRCLCVDERGNVWVGSPLGKVYQVSADGARILHTISEGEDIPSKTICYDRNASSLITISNNKIAAVKFIS